MTSRAAPLAPAIAALMAVTVVLRSYVFFVTNEQAVWWDEAEYLLLGREIVGEGGTGVVQQWRPLGLPYILAGFFALGLGETAIRLGLVLASVGTVWLTLRIGERTVGPVAALVGAALFSACYLPLFYTGRILTEIPHLLVALLGVYTYFTPSPRLRWASIPLLACAALIRPPDIALLGLVFVHWVTFRSSSRDRRRLLQTALTIGVATALLAWALSDQLSEIWHAWSHMVPRKYWSERGERFLEHLMWIFDTLGILPTGLLIVGLASWVVRSERRSELEHGYLFLATWTVVVIVPFAVWVKLHDRYLILALPPIFLAIGHAASLLTNRVSQRNKRLHSVILAAIVAISAIPMVQHSNTMILARTRSFSTVRDVADWLSRESLANEGIVANSAPQLAYYSNRDVRAIPDSADEFVEEITKRNVRFLVLSKDEEAPEWVQRTPPHRVGLREVARFPVKPPKIVVFEVVTPKPRGRSTERTS